MKAIDVTYGPLSRLHRPMAPNHSLERTLHGSPHLSRISFWATRVLSFRAAQLERISQPDALRLSLIASLVFTLAGICGGKLMLDIPRSNP